jgi:hypothetical protein
VSPLLPGAAGLAALLTGFALLRRLGPRFRVARLLASAPVVSIDEALAMAHGGQARYVLVHGRIRSEEEFPDEQDRPLVYRRRRLEIAEPGGPWRIVEEEREAVPFGVEERGGWIGVDAAHLGDGLVVLSREAEGVAAEVPDRVPPGTPPTARVRHRALQISAIEQADVVGVPTLDAGGQPTMSEGLGRPLILSTLERPAAMRVLAEGRRNRMRFITASLAIGALLLCLALALALVQTLAGPS